MVLQFLSYLTGDADPSSSAAAASSSDDLDEEARDAAVAANWQRYWTSQPPADLLRLRRSNDLQKLVRRGVPMDDRAAFWRLCVGAAIVPGRYAELVASAPALLRRSAAAKQIDKDLHRTYGAMRGVRVPQHEAVASLRNVLLAYAAHNAEVGYCQSMNFLAAVLLLVADEETAFWCLVALVERVLPGHFSSSMAMSLVDQGVLRELLGELDPELMGHLDSLGVAPSLVTTQWLLTCFVGAALPLGTLLRLWDCLLYELSPAFLLRAAAALFLLRAPALRAAPSASDAYELLTTLGADGAVATADALLGAAYAVNGSTLAPAPLAARRKTHAARLAAEGFAAAPAAAAAAEAAEAAARAADARAAAAAARWPAAVRDSAGGAWPLNGGAGPPALGRGGGDKGWTDAATLAARPEWTLVPVPLVPSDVVGAGGRYEAAEEWQLVEREAQGEGERGRRRSSLSYVIVQLEAPKLKEDYFEASDAHLVPSPPRPAPSTAAVDGDGGGGGGEEDIVTTLMRRIDLLSADSFSEGGVPTAWRQPVDAAAG